MKQSSVIIKFFSSFILFTCGCSKEEGVNNNTPTPPTNIAPSADAGPDKVRYLPRDTVLIDARLSKDRDGTITLYSLTQIEGPAPSTIENHPSIVGILLVKNLVAGSYIFQLKVTDDKGTSTTDIVHVYVVQGLPSGAELVLDSLSWEMPWDPGEYVLITPERSDLFPDIYNYNDTFYFPADMYVRYDTATTWVKLPLHNRNEYVDGRQVYIVGKRAHIVDGNPHHLYGRHASLRIKFH